MGAGLCRFLCRYKDLFEKFFLIFCKKAVLIHIDCMRRIVVAVIFFHALAASAMFGEGSATAISIKGVLNGSAATSLVEKSCRQGINAPTAVLIPIAAYVNEDIIMRTEVQQLAQERQISYPEALNALIEQRLLLQDFNRKKGKISDAQIDINMENILQSNFHGNRQAMRQVLQAQGQSFYGLKEDVRQSMIIHVMRQRNTLSPFSISPKQVEAYYRSHQQEFQMESRYLIQQSGFQENATLMVGGKEERKVDLLQQLVQNKTTLSLIQKQLDEFSSKPIWYSFSELQPKLRNELLLLTPGESTPYLKLNNVYVTSQLVQVVPATIKPLAEVQSDIEEKLLIEVNSNIYNQYIQYLRQLANIRIVDEPYGRK